MSEKQDGVVTFPITGRVTIPRERTETTLRCAIRNGKLVIFGKKKDAAR
jgi:hypothetical protein